MLDAELKEQLKSHLSGLGHTVELVVSASAHEQQAELVEMLNDVAECSDELHVRVTDVSADLPQFAVHADGRPTGMRFVGIPGAARASCQTPRSSVASGALAQARCARTSRRAARTARTWCKHCTRSR